MKQVEKNKILEENVAPSPKGKDLTVYSYDPELIRKRPLVRQIFEPKVPDFPYPSTTFRRVDEYEQQEEQISEEKRYTFPNKKLEDREKNLYTSYIESKNKLYLYKLIVLQYSKYLSTALITNFRTKIIKASADNALNKQINYLIEEMVRNGISLVDEDLKVIREFITGIYADESSHKLTYMNLVDLKMCNNLIEKAVRKGIIIDEEIQEIAKTINLEELYLKGDCLELCYIHSIHAILFLGIREIEYDMFQSLSRCHLFLDQIPDISVPKDLDEADVIEIDGRKFSKHIFELITESSYESFIGNLELETILNNNAEESVVDSGEFKLL